MVQTRLGFAGKKVEFRECGLPKVSNSWNPKI